MSWKRLAVAAAWGLALAVWAGIVSYKVIADPGLKEWTIAVSMGALAFEGAIWATAAVLGLSLWQSRKATLAALTRPFRRRG